MSTPPPPPVASPKRVSGGGARVLLNWKAIVGVGISAFLLWYVFRDQPLDQVLREIASADLPLLLLATAVATSVFWIRAWRWRPLLDPVRPGTSFKARFEATCIGFMANNVLPVRIGEFARPYALSRLEPVPVVAALSSLVIERMFDAFTLIAMLFVAMLLPGFPAWPADAAVDFPGIAQRLAFFMGLGALALFALVLWPRPAVRFFESMANRVLPRPFRRPLVDALEAFLAGASVLRSGRLLVQVGLWSVVLWIVNATGFWIAMRAFDLDLSLTAAIFFNSCIAFIVAVPAGPGFVGTFEAAADIVLADLWGQETTRVLAFALGFHIASFVPVTVMGLYYAGKLGLSLTSVAKSEEVVEQAVEQATKADAGS